MVSAYIYPFPYAVVKGKVTQLFGQWPGGNNPRGGHTGIDFAVPEGTAVLAPCDGIIEFEGWVTGEYYENPWWFLASDMVAVVNAGPGKPSFTVGHLSATLVNRNQYVKKGQVIGYSGNTGISTGPHCHFEYLPDNWDYQNGTYGRLDPQLVCEYWDGSSSLEPAGNVVTAPVIEGLTHWAIDISNFQGDINIASVNPDRVIIRTS
jgi:murein DD-endopeptidase MepM/ murein hydrolase activator NlpD